MRKVLLWIGIIFVAMLVITFVAGLIAHEPLPEGEPGPAADSLARRMEAAVNKEAWDSTVLVQWTFAGMHHFLWDKERDFCRVQWDDKEVLLDLNTITGKAWQDGQALEGEAAKELMQQAWSYFANDSFWLNACVKAFDPGTERRLLRLAGGDEGLLVTYTKGGVTPGDSYLWILDEDGLPQRWKMWVSILPVGGVSATWEDWTTLDSGARIATTHKNAMFTLEITDLRGARSREDFGLSQDPFLALEVR